MTEDSPQPNSNSNLKSLPRNVWAVSLTSFFMDISSEMVINILPLFLFNVLGVKTPVIGLIEGVAESTSSLLKLFSGWLSDKLGERKWLAVTGYALSAITKPFFYIAGSWAAVAGVRWVDRLGKGIRTAPRDALVADSVKENQRGLAFGFQRAADTAGALVGLLIALLAIWLLQSNSERLLENTFRTIVLISIAPAFLAVLVLVIGAHDTAVTSQREIPKFALLSLGKPFLVFMIIISIFELGNSSDAFLLLRAQERGLSVGGVLSMLIVFNLIYALIAAPAGGLSDHIGRSRVIIFGWLIYGIVYLGIGLSQSIWQVWVLYVMYGLYYGLAYGTSKAMVADLVDENVRGTAYGTFNAVVGIMALPASLIAGILWQGLSGWAGFGAPAPFIFGGVTALIAALLLKYWLPSIQKADSQITITPNQFH